MRRRMWAKFFGIAAALTLSPTMAVAVSAESLDGDAIMRAVDARPDGDRQTSRALMVVKDSAGGERRRVFQSRVMDFSEGTKTLIIFEGPADVRNTGMLSIDYDDGARSDHQWLYLPSLRKSTRIASSDKSGSFMGSDLSYSDMTTRDPGDYKHAVLKPSVRVDGEDCWLIEARPANGRTAKETGYVKSHLWISKSKMMPLKAKHWVKEGKKLKLVVFADIRNLDGIWTPHKIVAQTRRARKVESKTVVAFMSVKNNQESVKSPDFTQRRLEQGL